MREQRNGSDGLSHHEEAHWESRELREAFHSYLPLGAGLEPHLAEALRQVLGNSGSMLRSQIVLNTAAAYSMAHLQAKQLAIALEYFHSASLLFDDLPCMDNATHRRGLPCIHVRFGEPVAILAALALVNRAYSLIWQSVYAAPSEHRTKAIAFIEQNLGIGGLLNGQSLDLHYASLPHDRETTERVALGKTVSLIKLTLVLPALLGGAPTSELRLLDRVARFWGLSYQIVDDLKDVLQNADDTGKTGLRDASLDRPNIANSIGFPAAIERLERFISLGDRIVERLVLRNPSLVFLRQLRADMSKEAVRVTGAAQEICANVSLSHA